MEGPQGKVAHTGGNPHLVSVIGGSVGALTGMYLFRHKTQKRKFNLGIPAILLTQAILTYFIFLR